MISHSLSRINSQLVLTIALLSAVEFADASVSLAQEQPAKPEQAATSPDYTTLAQPEIAERLGLTEEQRTKITELLKQRAEAIGKAAEPERPKVAAENDALLSAVLSEEQRTEFLAGKKTPQLRFNFRFQRWAEVLQWLANEADLSLVMDAPPPATFNYTDGKTYTPTEAIDLLNGVLLTKDFTLIRRGRMLIVVDMKEGIPQDLIPRVELKDLEDRGKHEIVSVMFPLGKRNATEVDAEINPLLGARGKSIPLPKTQQILVTATAGNMRAIGAVIDSIPQPAAPPKPPAPKPPEKPELRFYPVKSADVGAAIEVLTQLIGGVKFVSDPKTDRINAYATPSQHAAIKGLLDKMEVENPPEKQPRLELYSIGRTDASQLEETLKLIVPDAKIRIDTAAQQLVAWGTPEEQNKLKTALERMGSGGPDQKTSQIGVYQLTKVEPGPAQELLQSILPKARISIDAQNRTLIVVGTPEDQRIVKATLDQLQPEQPGPNTPSLQFYPYPKIVPSGLAEVLQRLAPQAQIRVDGRKLVVVATSTDHQLIAETIKKFPPPLEKEKNRLEIYNVSGTQLKRFQTVLASVTGELPGIRITPSPQSGELLVWAKAYQHEALRGILEKLKQDSQNNEQPALTGYPVPAERQPQVISLLQTAYPDVQVIPDAPGGKLLVWASPEQHGKLKSTLDQILAEAPAEERPRFQDYPVAGAQASELIPQLQALLPSMRLTVDSKTSRLIAWGTPSDHEKLATAIEKISGRDADSFQQVEVYRLSKADLNATMSLLQSLVPSARITVDSSTRSIVAVATTDEQKTIKATLEQLDPTGESPHDRRLRFIMLAGESPPNLMTVLQQLAPQAQITLDNDGKRLMVIATAADHAVVEASVERIMEAAATVEKPVLETYAVSAAQRRRFQAVLSDVQGDLPGIRIITDAEPGELSVWAKPSQHAVLAEILEKLRREVPENERFTLVTYSLKGENGAQTQELMQTLFPGTRFIADIPGKRLLAWARPEDHVKLKEALDKLQSDDAPENQPRFESYPVLGSTAGELIPILQPLVPGMRLTVNPKTSQLVAWGIPKEHVRLKAAIGKLGGGDNPLNTPQVEVYQMTKADPSTAQTLLQSLFPNARFSVDAPTRSLIAVAIPTEQQAIRATIEQLQPQNSGPNARSLQFIPLEQTPPASLIGVLQQLTPQAQVTYDEKDKRLMVVADAADHEIIRETVKRVIVTAVPEQKNRLEVYPVTPAQRKRFEAIIGSVQNELPGIRVITDAEPGELAIWAKPRQHETLADLIAKLKRETPADEKHQFVAYQIQFADAANTLAVMQSLFPGVKFVLDAKTKKLFVWAPSEQHQRIKEAIDKIDTKVSAELQERFQIYPVPNSDPNTVISMLQELLPDVKFTSDRTAKTIIAWARQSDHVIIDAAMKQIRAGLDPKRMPRLVVFDAGEIDPSTVVRGISRLFPNAQVEVDSTSRRVLVWTTDEEQEQVREALRQVAEFSEKQGDATMVIYPVKPEVISVVYQIVQSAVPQARSMLGGSPPRLVAWANPRQHKEIAAIVKQIEEKAIADRIRELVVYELEGVDPDAVMQLIDPVLQQQTQFITSSDRKRLIVRASQERQAELKTAIDQAKAKLPKVEEPVSQIYQLKYTNPNSLVGVLRPMIPSAPMVPDMRYRTLVVTATPKEHAKIAETIEKIDVEHTGENSPYLKSYQITKSEPGTVFGVVNHILAGHPEVQLSFDSSNGAIIAFAYPDQHKKIAETIADIEKDVEGATSEVYRFRSADPNTAAGILRPLVPRARMTVDNRNRSLVAHAIPADHEIITNIIAKIDDETNDENGARLKAYPVQSAEPSNLLNMLHTNFALQPDIRLSADYKNETILALATPEQHEKIAEFIAEVDKQGKVRTPHVYHFRTADPNAAIGILRSLAPKSQMAVDNRSRSLVVSATADEHQTIAETIKQMDVESNDESTAKLKAYPIRLAEPGNLLSMLQTNFARQPEIRLSADYKNETIVALATPAQHEKIAEFIAEVDKQGKVRTPQVYRFRTADPNAASGILRTLAPKAQIAVDNRNRSLVVSATEEEHAIIQATIEEMDAESNDDSGMILKSYSVKTAEPNNLLAMLRTNFALQPDVRLSLDSRNDSIVALATPQQHDKIQEFVAEVEKNGIERRAEVYRLRIANPNTAAAALRSLLPNAQIVADGRNQSLVATASDAEHKKIAEVVAGLDEPESADTRSELRAYPLKATEGRTLQRTLQSYFRRHDDIEISFDQENESIVAIAPARMQEQIAQMVAEVERAAGTDPASTLEVYRLKRADARTALEVLENAFQRETPKIKLTFNRRSGQITAVATPDQHAMIQRTLDELDHDDRELEVFQLDVLEPFAAEMSIDRLFGGDEYGDPNYPIVDSDSNSQQLFVRATRQQLGEIRDLLVKMGERGLSVQKSTGKNQRMRVIPFRGNAADALREIQRVWPQIRKNNIRVVTPSAVVPTLKRPGMRDSSVVPPNEKSEKKSNAQFAVPAEEPEKTQSKSQDNAAIEAEKSTEIEVAQATDDSDKKTTEKPLPPIIVAPGDGSITIASDDPEALDQFESLLRAMSVGHRGSRGNDFVVFSLRYTSAVQTATTLEDLFGLNNNRRNRGNSFQNRVATGSVSIVPDERLNAIIVHANRHDREMIENLLQVLDAEDVPESLAANRPKLIPVKNTDAVRIERVIRSVYSTAMKTGGGARPIPVPSGVSQEVAAAIQRVNAASTGPLLTVEVDERTNTLIVMAPQSLVEEIEQLVADLDHAASDDSSRRLKVIQLKRLNIKSLGRSLDMLIDSRSRRRGRR